MKKVQEIIKQYGTADKIFRRILGIYFIMSAIQLIQAHKNELDYITNWQTFISEYSLFTKIIWIISIFCCISLFYSILEKSNSKWAGIIDSAVMIFGTLFFSCCLMWRNDNFYLCIAVSLTASVFIAYSASKIPDISLKYGNKTIAVIIAVIAVTTASFVCITAVCKHKIFGTTCFDMGIFVQMFHSLSEDFTAVTTCERGASLSHFNVHASYIFYLLVPVYKIFPREETLIICQAILAVSGVIPIFLIAKNKGFKGYLLLFPCLIYIFSGGILAPCYYHFHENCFLPPLLLWLVYAVEKRNYRLFFIMSVLVCIVKEDAPLYVMCIALYFITEEKGRSRLYGIIIFALSAVYFIGITNYLTKYGDGSMMMSTRFGNLTIEQQKGFIGIAQNIIAHPAYFVSLFIQENTFIFFVQMLLPTIFIPFMTKKINRFFLMIPFVIMNLVIGSGYGYAAEMGYQYTFGTSSLLIYLTIINLADLKYTQKKIFTVTASAVSVITAFFLITPHADQYEQYKERKEHFQAVENCLDTIPKDASVISNTIYLPHIADRYEIYNLNDEIIVENGILSSESSDIESYDFYVLSSWDKNDILPLIELYGYTLFAECEDTVYIYQSPEYKFEK